MGHDVRGISLSGLRLPQDFRWYFAGHGHALGYIRKIHASRLREVIVPHCLALVMPDLEVLGLVLGSPAQVKYGFTGASPVNEPQR